MQTSALSVSENFFPSHIIHPVDELVLVEIQHIRVVRPVIPIFEHKLVAEAHSRDYREIQLDVLN